jgi:hypothetical protein
MSEREPLPIVPSWSRAIRYRPSLRHRLSSTFCPVPRRLSLEAERRSPSVRPENQPMSATAMLQLKQQLSRLSDKERQKVTACAERRRCCAGL